MIKDAVHILGVQTQNERYHLLEFRHSCPYGFSLSSFSSLCLPFFLSFILSLSLGYRMVLFFNQRVI